MSRMQKEKAKVQHITVTADQAARRIDNYLLGRFGALPRTRVYQMLRRGEVRINGGRIRQNYRLQAGDVVRIPPIAQDHPAATQPPPAYLLDKMRERVIFEDEELIVLNKPAGIVVHSGSGRNFGVIELLRLLRPQEPGLQLVHRLDRETSGCLLIAKDMRTLRRLHADLKVGSISKQYQAMLAGRLSEESVEIDLPVRKNILVSGERMAAAAQAGRPGKAARTHFAVERRFQDCTLVRACIETGRTHQIRVHAGSIGHPLLGDDKYGDKAMNRSAKQRGLRRLFLHADRLELPRRDGNRAFAAALPEDLEKFMLTCR